MGIDFIGESCRDFFCAHFKSNPFKGPKLNIFRHELKLTKKKKINLLQEKMVLLSKWNFYGLFYQSESKIS